MPLRAYLAGLAALFVIAAGAAVIYSRVQSSSDARAAAAADARFAARLAAKETGTGVAQLQQTVAGAAANPGIGTAFTHPSECALSFGGTDAYTTGHVDLIKLDGKLVCSSRKGGGTYAGAPWLARAVKEPLLIAPTTDPRTGRQVVLAAAPVKGLGVVLAVFDLAGVSKSLQATYGGPRGLEFRLTHGATLLGGTSLGGKIRASAAVPGTGWTVTAGADRARALAASRRLNHRELAIIVIGLALFLLAVWIAHRRIARPLARLTGELEAPGPVTVAGPREVRALATRLNELGGAYRTLFDGTPLPTRVHDLDSRRILEANTAALEAYGYTHDELLALTVDALEHSPGVHVRKDGSMLEVNVASHSIAFRGHDACVVIAEDVTEKERLRHQLQQSQRLESLGQLAGGVAHDFNNLLAVIINYAAFMRGARREAARPSDDGRRRRRRSAGGRARRRADPPAAGLRPPRGRAPQVLDLNDVVPEIEQLLRRTLGEHVELDDRRWRPDLWPIMADPGQFEQVLVNLAVNARDAMPDGGHAHHRHRRTSTVDDAYASARSGLPAGRYVRLRVSDTGTGMTPRGRRARVRAVLHHQAQGRRAPGLGLATVYGIVTQAGGHVQIYSEPGPGHHLHHPAARDRPGPSRAPARRSRPPGAGAARRSSWSRTRPRCCDVTRRILAATATSVLIAAAAARRRSRLAAGAPRPDRRAADRRGHAADARQGGRRAVPRAAAEIRVLFMSGYAQPVLAPQGDLDAGRRR